MRLLVAGLTAFCATQLGAGELTISPTLESTMYYAKVQSDNEELVRDDAVSLNNVNLLSEYLTEQFYSRLNVDIFDIKYSDFTEGDTSFVEYDWWNKLNLLNENLTLTGSVSKSKDALNTVRSSFSDYLYNDAATYDIESQMVMAEYAFPEHWALDGRAELFYRKNSTEDNYDDELNNVYSKYASLEIGQTTYTSLFYWNIVSNVGESNSTDDSKYQYVDVDALVRAPLYSDFYLVALGNMSNHKNPETSSDSEEIEYSMYGVGLSWYSPKRSTLIQFTAEKDTDADDITPGAEVKVETPGGTTFSGTFTRRFYGDSGSVSLAQKTERSNVTLSYEEDIDLSYSIATEVVNEGYYVCTGVTEYDEAACFLPVGSNYELVEGDILYPKYHIEYPLVERLTLNRITSLKWDYTRGNWSSTLLFARTNQKEIGSDYTQVTNEGSISITQRLSDTSNFKYEAKYQDTETKPYGYAYQDTLYKLSFENELNSKASWSVGVQVLNKNASENESDFTDYRVFLSYKHHFGSRNKYRREME